MKNILLLLFLFLFQFSSFAQHGQKIDFGDGHSGVFNIDFGQLAMRTGQTARDWLNPKLNNETLGSQFLDDLFYPARIILKSDTMVEGVDIRYNIFARHMQIKTRKDTLILIHPEKVKSLEFNKRKFVHEQYLQGSELKDPDYFEVLAEGKCRLLRYREIKLLKKNPPLTPMSPGTDFDRLDLMESFCLQHQGEPVQFIKPNRKSVLAALKTNRADLERFVEKENIRFDQPDDLIKLISFFNSL